MGEAMHRPVRGGGGGIRTHEAVKLWFSKPVQLTTMRHLQDQYLIDRSPSVKHDCQNGCLSASGGNKQSAANKVLL